MKVILIIEDTDAGIDVKRYHQASTTEIVAAAEHTDATELGDFLECGIDLWLETISLNTAQLRAYAQSLVAPSPKHH